jgi:hypothetical protein
MTQAGRHLRPGLLTPEQSLHPAVNELIEAYGLAAGRVERFGRDTTRRPGDDGAKIGLLDQRIHVDPSYDVVEIDAFKHGADIDALQDTVQVHPVEQSVHVYPVQQRGDVHPVEQGVHVHPVQQGVHVYPL